MATTFINGIEVRPGRSHLQTAFDSISYIINPEKTQDGKLVSSLRCSPNSAHFEMILDQSMYEQETGRKVIWDYGGKKKSYLLMAMRQSFKPGTVTPEQAHKIGCELADKFLKGKYQYVIATHIDKAHIHNHIIFNIIGSDKKKFRLTKYTSKQLREVSDKICLEHGLSVVVPKEWQKKRYTSEKFTSYRAVIKNDIDRCINEAEGYEDFLNRMRKIYYVTDTGDVLKFRHKTNGQQRNLRSYTLGKGYTRQDIRARVGADEELIDPLTFSQKLRDIEAMIHAKGFINENGSDFDKQSENLTEAIKDTQRIMVSMRRKLAEAESISKCFDAVERYRPIYDMYRSGSMTQDAAREHENEIELYRAAVRTLRENHIRPNNSAREKFSEELSDIRSAADKLKDTYIDLQKRLDRVKEVRWISERVYAGDQVIATKKGGKYHGW